jgi:hypothetical protein
LGDGVQVVAERGRAEMAPSRSRRVRGTWKPGLNSALHRVLLPAGKESWPY